MPFRQRNQQHICEGLSRQRSRAWGSRVARKSQGLLLEPLSPGCAIGGHGEAFRTPVQGRDLHMWDFFPTSQGEMGVRVFVLCGNFSGNFNLKHSVCRSGRCGGGTLSPSAPTAETVPGDQHPGHVLNLP